MKADCGSNEQNGTEEEKEISEFPILVQLDYPIQFGKTLISSMTVNRRLRAGDLKGIPQVNLLFDDSLKLIMRLTGQPMPVVEQLDASDLQKFSRIIDRFL